MSPVNYRLEKISDIINGIVSSAVHIHCRICWGAVGTARKYSILQRLRHSYVVSLTPYIRVTNKAQRINTENAAKSGMVVNRNGYLVVTRCNILFLSSSLKVNYAFLFDFQSLDVVSFKAVDFHIFIRDFVERSIHRSKLRSNSGCGGVNGILKFCTFVIMQTEVNSESGETDKYSKH